MDKIALKIPGYEVKSVAGMPAGGFWRFQNILQDVITILLIVAVIAALFFLIWGGIQWITSGGDKAKIDGARKRIVYSIIGLIVAFGSFMIVNIVAAFLGLGDVF